MSSRSTQPDATTADLAYSYVRFSSRDQATGDSLRRQMEASAEWCKRHNATLDTSLALHDEGVSAFHGKHRENPDKHALAAFLKLAEQGRIPRGSYLIVESLDRLTREYVRAATTLFFSILEQGIHIVTTDPERLFRHDSQDMTDVIIAVVDLTRGHGESKRKCDLLGAAWGNKKQLARTNGSVQTTRCPAWLEVVGREKVGKHMHGGEYREIPERVKVVKRIFTLALKSVGNKGHGLSRIVQELTKVEVPTFGRSGKWSKAYVRKILTNRAVLGEYQPHKGGAPEGDAIGGYYPAIIDAETFERAAGALLERRDQRGSPGKKTANLFGRLLWDARTRSRMLIAWQSRGTKAKGRVKARVLVPADSMEGAAVATSFPHGIFETAVLSCLEEIDAHEVLGNGHAKASADISTELHRVRLSIEAINAAMDANGESPSLLKRLSEKDAAAADLAARLAVARQKEHHPPAAALTEAQALITAATRDAETRARLRQLLRQCIDRVTVLVVPLPGTSQRLAAIQIDFAEGRGGRSYLIRYWTKGYCREGGWQVRSWTDESLRKAMMPQQFDLRAAGPTVLGEDDEGQQAVVSGWQEVEHDLLGLSAEDLDQLVFADCPRHPLP